MDADVQKLRPPVPHLHLICKSLGRPSRCTVPKAEYRCLRYIQNGKKVLENLHAKLQELASSHLVPDCRFWMNSIFEFVSITIIAGSNHNEERKKQSMENKVGV